LSQIKEVPYILDDRDRLIRVEEQIKSLETQIKSLRDETNIRFEAMQKEFVKMHIPQEKILDKLDVDKRMTRLETFSRATH